jgi:hypothetical protein
VPGTLFRVDNLVELDRQVFPASNAYLVAADDRFLVAVRAEGQNLLPIQVVLDWPALIGR